MKVKPKRFYIGILGGHRYRIIESEKSPLISHHPSILLTMGPYQSPTLARKDVDTWGYKEEF